MLLPARVVDAARAVIPHRDEARDEKDSLQGKWIPESLTIEAPAACRFSPAACWGQQPSTTCVRMKSPENIIVFPMSRGKRSGQSQADKARFRLHIDPQLLELIRNRAASLNMDVNQFLEALARQDIRKGGPLEVWPIAEPVASSPTHKVSAATKPAKAAAS